MIAVNQHPHEHRAQSPAGRGNASSENGSGGNRSHGGSGLDDLILEELIYQRVRLAVDMSQLVLFESDLEISIRRALARVTNKAEHHHDLGAALVDRAWRRVEDEWRKLRSNDDLLMRGPCPLCQELQIDIPSDDADHPAIRDILGLGIDLGGIDLIEELKRARERQRELTREEEAEAARERSRDRAAAGGAAAGSAAAGSAAAGSAAVGSAAVGSAAVGSAAVGGASGALDRNPDRTQDDPSDRVFDGTFDIRARFSALPRRRGTRRAAP